MGQNTRQVLEILLETRPKKFFVVLLGSTRSKYLIATYE